MARQQLDPRLGALLPLVRGIADLFGPDCEVVLHEVGRLPHSIVAIENGSVTGRSVGGAATDRMLRSLRQAADTQDVRVYSSSHDGRILKSLAVTLRGDDGSPYGLFGINFDVSGMIEAQHALARVITLGSSGDDTEHELFSPDIRDVVAGMVGAILAEMGRTPAGMSRDEKMEVVRRLDERGAFLVKRSAEQIAEALDLSRYTIFSYLKEIRRRDRTGLPGAPEAPGKGTG